MAKLISFLQNGTERVGAILPSDRVLDLGLADPDPALASMLTLIEGGHETLAKVRHLVAYPPEGAVVALSGVRLLAPLPRPPRLRDTVMFLDHMEKGLKRWARQLAEAKDDPEAALQELMASGRFDLAPVFRERVIYYNANHLAVSGPEDEIIWPAESTHADFELEWACVISRRCRNVTTSEEARQAIFGYTIFNDWSARDLQLRFMAAGLGPSEGKDFALANTLGPCIVTRDEIEEPYAQVMEARVNGERWSRGTSATMHHRFEDAIMQFSALHELVPGEVIGSGTVADGSGYELGRKLADGDLVELHVSGIGTLRNRVRIPALLDV